MRDAPHLLQEAAANMRLAPALTGDVWADLRQTAQATIDATPWPTGREETWRHTRARPLSDTSWAPAPSVEVSHATLEAALFDGALTGPRLVFVNGHFAPTHSEIPAQQGVTCGSLASVAKAQPALLAPHVGSLKLHAEPGFAALNTAFLHEGAVLHLAAGCQLEAPLRLIFVSTAEASQAVAHPRVLIVLEAGSRAQVMEVYGGAKKTAFWTNAVTECRVGDNAQLHYAGLQLGGNEALWMSHMGVELARDAQLTADLLFAGSAWSRRELTVRLAAPGALARLTGLTLGAHQEHSDLQVRLEHLAPHTMSFQHFRSLLDEESTGVFGGMVFVAEDAQKTDAAQMCRNLILSSQARAHAKPGLEILADDVKCSHGATVSQLDKQALFYLRSRGIDAQRAKQMLTAAFADAVLADAHSFFRDALLAASRPRLGASRATEVLA